MKKRIKNEKRSSLNLNLCPMIFQRRLLYHSGSNLQFPFVSLKHFLEPQLLIQQHFTVLKYSNVLPSSENLCDNISSSSYVFSGPLNPKSLIYESSGPPFSFCGVSSQASPSCLPAFFSFVSWGDPNARRAHAHSHICF